ncbi:hypothetical protein ACFU7Y_34320 [Kitasatospora sp. NPDC057542]|uniref:hypothetical protein n=1 Tax=Kitasatospora sp. NPDC057542 TaxID=3346162 RepID=UPI0036A14294
MFPEVVEVARALLDPVMAELVWRDSGAGRPRALPADGAFCRRLGERVGRRWLGPLAAVDFDGPLIVRRRHPGPPKREQHRTGQRTARTAARKHLTAARFADTATFAEAVCPGVPVPDEQKPAVRHGRGHLLDVGRIHAAFVTGARARGEACGPLDLVPAPQLPASGAEVGGPAAHTAGTGDERHRLRAFIERHRGRGAAGGERWASGHRAGAGVGNRVGCTTADGRGGGRRAGREAAGK